MSEGCGFGFDHAHISIIDQVVGTFEDVKIDGFRPGQNFVLGASVVSIFGAEISVVVLVACDSLFDRFEFVVQEVVVVDVG